MNSRDLVRLVVSNLGRMKGRVIMTAIGVVIGTAAVVVLVSLAAGLRQSAVRDLSSIGSLTDINVYPMQAPFPFGVSATANRESVLNDRMLDEFRSLPGVVAVTPKELLIGGGGLRYKRLFGGSQILGIDPGQLERLGFQIAAGTARLGGGQIIVGARVGESFFDPIQGIPVREPIDLLGQTLQLTLTRTDDEGKPVERTMRLRVAGVLKKTGGEDDYTVYMSLQDVVELNRWYSGRPINPARDGYYRALIKVESPDRTLAVEREVTQRGFFAYSARSAVESLNQFFLIIQGIFGGIGAIALLVAAFGIANTMLMSVYERTREIGLMKAIGATNRDVMSVFLSEAGGIGMLGGIGGALLGIALGWGVNLVARTYLMAQAARQGAAVSSDSVLSLVYTPFWLPIFAILFATGVGVLSGLYPATRAASLNPITALRYE